MPCELGFFHPDYPYSQDIAIAPEMESALGGRQHVIARVAHVKVSEWLKTTGIVTVDGKLYRVRRESFGECRYWLLYSPLEEEKNELS